MQNALYLCGILFRYATWSHTLLPCFSQMHSSKSQYVQTSHCHSLHSSQLSHLMSAANPNRWFEFFAPPTAMFKAEQRKPEFMCRGLFAILRNGSRIIWQRTCKFIATYSGASLHIPSLSAVELRTNSSNTKCSLNFIYRPERILDYVQSCKDCGEGCQNGIDYDRPFIFVVHNGIIFRPPPSPPEGESF